MKRLIKFFLIVVGVVVVFWGIIYLPDNSLFWGNLDEWPPTPAPAPAPWSWGLFFFGGLLALPLLWFGVKIPDLIITGKTPFQRWVGRALTLFLGLGFGTFVSLFSSSLGVGAWVATGIILVATWLPRVGGRDIFGLYEAEEEEEVTISSS